MTWERDKGRITWGKSRVLGRVFTKKPITGEVITVQIGLKVETETIREVKEE